MKNRLVYKNPVDTMNKAIIKIKVSSDYKKSIPAYYKKFTDVSPITSLIEGSPEEVISFPPISEICNMLADGVNFTIYDDEDIEYAIDSINVYLNMFYLNGKRNKEKPEVEIFLDNCLVARDKLIKATKHKEKYKTGTTKLSGIKHTMAALLGLE